MPALAGPLTHHRGPDDRLDPAPRSGRPARAVPPPRPAPARIGEILVRNGALAPDRLRIALVLQKGDGRRLGEILVARRWAAPEAVAAAAAVQAGMDR
jgi:hypothetical protein